MVVDLFDPRYPLKKNLEICLDNIVDHWGTVQIGDVTGVNISDAVFAVTIASGQAKKKRSWTAAFTGAKDRSLVVRPYAFDVDHKLEIHSASPEKSSLLFIFSYTRHPTDGVVRIAYQHNHAADIPFQPLASGLCEMQRAYDKIRKELDNHYWGYGCEHALAKHWIEKDSQVKAKLALPSSQELAEIERTQGGVARIRRATESVTHLARELAERYAIIGDCAVDRRQYVRRASVF
ncbi:MAG: hypothetical protein AABX82_05045 [Nanoarchaeota archaeon]